MCWENFKISYIVFLTAKTFIMPNLIAVLLLLIVTTCAAQQNILVPYRVADKFGLSDLKGNIKVEPQYDMMEPIGVGYYKCSNNQIGFDTSYRSGGRMTVEEKMIRITGVYAGTKLIINNSRHRHFTFAEQGLLIGSEESYISRNSNFYNLKGERLLSKNVEKFKFIGGSTMEIMQQKQSPIISILAEHYDGSVSLLLFDSKSQKMLKPQLDRVTNFDMDRDAGNESFFVCSYMDSNYTYEKSKVYFDIEKQHYVVAPYTDESYNSNSFDGESTGEYLGESTYGGDYGVVEEYLEPMNDIQSEGVEVPPMPQIPAAKPKPIYPFIKINDTTIAYGNDTIRAGEGQKFSFYDRYSKSQMQSIIVSKDKKYSLLFPDSLSTSLLYDSLRYIKNQYGIFTFSHSLLYLAGLKNENSGEWKFGIIDQSGKEVIPIRYEYLSPNLPESSHERDEKTQKGHFKFRQPDDYSGDKDFLLTLKSTGLFVASKNGKQGVINLKNEEFMPFEYDMIWENGLSFLTTYKVDDDFCVYQKGERYGVFKIDHNQIKILDTGLIFPKIPVYVYRDYMGIKGMDIYNLADNDILYFCLQSSNGVLYYKK